jgi:uncharacterized protein YkwD
MTRSSLLRLVPAAGVLAAVLAGCLPEGNVDAASVEVTVDGSTVTVAGWAWDQDTPTSPIDVHVYFEAGAVATRADLPRPDVAAAKPGAGPDHGFQISVNVSAGNHRVCAYGINAPGTPGDNSLLGCRTFTVNPTPLQPAPTTTAPKGSTTTTTPGTSVPGPGTGTDTPPLPSTWQADLVGRINGARRDAGAGAVERCTALDTAAQSYADTMAANQWFDPTGPDGSDPWTRVDAYGGTSTGENLSFGFSDTASLLASQMASPDPQANLVRPEFTHVGVGRALGDPDGSGPAAATYYWTVELGTGGTC